MNNEQLTQIANQLNTQNNHATSHPIFLVQQRHRIYGMDPEYTNDYEWSDTEDREAGEPDNFTIEDLDRSYEVGGYIGTYEKVYYKDIWMFVQCFFTEEAAIQYIQANKHNLIAPRIYVESAYRNYEWQDIRTHLMSTPTPSNPSPSAQSAPSVPQTTTP